MAKLNRVERQRNYFNSIERLKALHFEPKRKSIEQKPYSKRTEAERAALAAAQKLYNEQQEIIIRTRLKAEAAQLRKELDDLFEENRIITSE